MNEENKYIDLCRAVERRACREVKTPRDFDYLSVCIEQVTHRHIGVSTLKRLWGYLGNKEVREPQRYTLDSLARYVGYVSYDAYVAASMGECDIDSDFVNAQSISADRIAEKERIRIMWNPDRVMIVRCEGDNTFIVEEVVNSKLSVGDCFCCDRFTQGEPLFLYNLVHEDNKPTGYVCGRLGGIRFNVLTVTD